MGLYICENKELQYIGHMRREEKEQEHQLLLAEKKRVPELFEMPPMIDTLQLLQWIGIEGVFGEYPFGHLKYLPEDFIVEEISLDKKISTVDIGSGVQNLQEQEGSTIYAELVKVGLTTFHAKDEIARFVEIPSQSIGTAGLKDEVAITSQRISLRKVRNLQLLENLAFEDFFVKNIVRGKGVLKKGQLWGNRFVITIRFAGPLQAAEKLRIEQSLKEISEQGFWNFYSFQRFAAPRFNGHIMGRHLLRGEYEQAIRTLLFYRGGREPMYFQHIRKDTENHWGNWKYIYQQMRSFPSQFPTELQFLEYLVERPNDLRGALRAIAEQVRLWLYAYSSYLFNKKLSQSIKEGEILFELPFVTSGNPKDWEHYEKFLKQDGITLPTSLYRDLPFLRSYSAGIFPTAPTLQQVEIHKAVFLENMMVLAFSLPKGAYATTFLAHLFQLSSEVPLPPGVSTNRIDAKEVVGLGSLGPVLERFRPVITRFEQAREPKTN